MISNQLKNAVDKWSNSFLRPLVPPKLMSNSEIEETKDDGAKLIYLKFLYGIRTGRFSERPSDGGIGNVIKDTSEESLWNYSLSNSEIPEGFNPLKKKGSGTIGTGNIIKCGTCRGQGKVRCKTCGGKVRWNSKDFEGNRIENVCSCGDGKQMCSYCDGFGEVEKIIITEREFKLFETKNSQYTGEVPEKKIKKITGDVIYEQVYDYPLENLREMLVGGIDASQFDKLNAEVIEFLKSSIDDHLIEEGDIDTQKIHSQLDILFNSLPNPGKENKVLEHEAMPIRVMVRVENAPVKQINYKYKEDKYSIWVYGKENSVWKQKAPGSFNYKGIILSILILGLIGTWTFSIINNNVNYSESKSKNADYDQKFSSATSLDTIYSKDNSLSTGNTATSNDKSEIDKGTKEVKPETNISNTYNSTASDASISNEENADITDEETENKLDFANHHFSASEIDNILEGIWKHTDRWAERNLKFEKGNELKLIYGETNNGAFIKYGGIYDIEFDYVKNGIKGHYFQDKGRTNKMIFTIQIIDDKTIKEITTAYERIYTR